MRKIITTVLALFSRLLVIIGLAGIPEDIKSWQCLVLSFLEVLSRHELEWVDLIIIACIVLVIFFWDSLAESKVPWFDERIPFLEARKYAIKRGLFVGDQNADSNPAYQLEKSMTQLAAEGKCKVWGRKFKIPMSHSPLVEIPTCHFVDFEVAHYGVQYAANFEVQNSQSHTTKGFKVLSELNNQAYCDLHFLKSDVLKGIKMAKKNCNTARC